MSKIETSTLTGSTEAKRLAEGIRNDVGWAEKKRAYAQELQKERNYFPVPPEMEYIRDSYKQEKTHEEHLRWWAGRNGRGVPLRRKFRSSN
ncbi:MAG: hypothetical protein H6774_01295 [Pseudomonadales bacterium]|nr:hypothetical protein [Pseudomonadales bacterium]